MDADVAITRGMAVSRLSHKIRSRLVVSDRQ